MIQLTVFGSGLLMSWAYTVPVAGRRMRPLGHVLFGVLVGLSAGIVGEVAAHMRPLPRWEVGVCVFGLVALTAYGVVRSPG